MFMGPRNWCQGMNSASLCSLAGRYENPIPPRCLAPIDFLKIPALTEKLLRIRFLSLFRVPGTALSLDDWKIRQDVQIVHGNESGFLLICFRLKIAFTGQNSLHFFVHSVFHRTKPSRPSYLIFFFDNKIGNILETSSQNNIMPFNKNIHFVRLFLYKKEKYWGNLLGFWR